VVEGPNQGMEFELSGSTTVGRDPSAGLVIDDAEASRRHASLSLDGENVMVEDLGSTNGTFVNGKRLTAAHTLMEGEKLRIGTTVFELRAAPAQATRVGTDLPDLDDIQVTAPRNVPDFAKDEPATGPPTEQQPPAAPVPSAPPPSSGPPAGPPAFEPPPPSAPPPPAGGPPPPPSSPPPSFGPLPGAAPATAPPAPAYGGPPAAYGGGAMAPSGGYPIGVEGDYPQAGIARWRVFFQGLLALPHFFVLFFLAIGAYIALIGAWFGILITGRYPPGVFNFVAGVMRWVTRVNGYNWLMTEVYPPFSMAEEPQYPIRATFRYPEGGIARWRVFFQGFLAIPHIIVLYLLAIAAYLAYIIAWFSILFTRNYPPGIFNFILGVMRWQTRVFGYYVWMTEEYPPFSLE
jgi:hypothetical protein